MRLFYTAFPIFCNSLRRKHYFVTIPIFYANAAPHIGHLYSAVIGDCAYRWNELKTSAKESSHNAIFSGGTDEHGLKIQKAAEKAQSLPLAFCDGISGDFRKLFNFFNVRPTIFLRTTEDRHKKTVAEIWLKLYDKGLISKSKYSGWYSAVDECFYTDDEIQSDGSNKKMSTLTGSEVEWVEEENYLFNLSDFLPAIRSWLTENEIIHPAKYTSVALQCIDALKTLSVSRDRKRLNWGIPVPNDASQTVYVWLDALMNYLTASGFPAENMLWPPTCQIIGKDILKFHAIYWPAFLLALGLPLPEKLLVHGHWLFDGVKMSKSVGNIVDPYVAADVLSADGLRYFLLRQGVPYSDSDFTIKKATDVINADLVNTLGNLLQRSSVKKLNREQVYPDFDGTVFDGDLRTLSSDLIENLNTLKDRCVADFDAYFFYKALNKIIEVARQANVFFSVCEPWNLEANIKGDPKAVFHFAWNDPHTLLKKKSFSDLQCYILHMKPFAFAASCFSLLSLITPHEHFLAGNKLNFSLGVSSSERELCMAVFFDGGLRSMSGRNLGGQLAKQPLLPRVLVQKENALKSKV